MSALGWSRLEDLFHRAAALSPKDRAAFLDAECASDPELRAELESLLGHDAPPGTGLEDAIQQEAEVMVEDQWLIDRRIGAYRIAGVIGEGGMGAVYEAVRDDDQYQKRVAIKLVRHGLETETVLQRFRDERQILASLDHPYIARLLDGGATSDGLPYLVMEFITGAPITRYVREHDLPLEQRLRLFQKVCEAVQYAHQSLVVHRDLKPANILVTDDGVPKLLDFGIAKLLTPVHQDSTATRIASWTPDYASPEQVLGRPVTTRTDVYSLGLVLFEMLTGERAQVADTMSASALERLVCQTELPWASSKAPRQIARRIAGDLDTIVAKATQKDPNRRYASAAEFDEDLGRYLDGRPVRARKDSTAYRVSKFVRRNWLAVGAATVAALGLVGGAIGFASEARVANRSRAIAEQQRIAAEHEQARAENLAREANAQRQRADKRSSDLSVFAQHAVFDLYGAVEKLSGSLEARQKMLQTTLDYMEQLRTERAGDPEFLRTLGSTYLQMGDLQGNPMTPSLGDLPGAVEYYRKSLAILEPLAEGNPSNLRYQIALVGPLEQIGMVMDRSGKLTEALRYYQRALTIARRAAALAPDDPQAVAQVAMITRDIALALVNDPDRQEPYALESLEIYAGLSRKEPANTSFLTNIATAYTRLASAASRHHNIQQAADYMRRNVEIQERLAALKPDDWNIQRNLFVSYEMVGDVLGGSFENLGDVQAAVEYYRKCIKITQRLLAKDPTSLTARSDLADAQTRLGRTLTSESQRTESLEMLSQALIGFEAGLALAPESEHLRYSAGFALTIMADRYRSAGDRARALDCVRRALEHLAWKSMAADADIQRQLILTRLLHAILLAEQGNRTAALQEVARAVETPKTQAISSQASFWPRYWSRLGEAQQAVGDWRAAKDAYQHSATEWRARLAPTRQAEIAQLESKIAQCEAALK